MVLSSCLLALLAAVPAVAASANTVTATGTGQARVRPANRHSNASIRAAYNAASKAAIAGAVRDAKERALDYARAVGLTLGSVLSVTDAQTNGFYGPGAGSFYGPFGPEQFCGTLRQPILKRSKHRIRVVGSRKVHRCFVPRFAFTSLTVTYSSS
ncbi:MAG: SIMPL domain-containing protein [Solirubrobacteraceae bacterium]